MIKPAWFNRNQLFIQHMCAITKHPNLKVPDEENEEKAFSHTESDYYSDLMLEAMQTSAIFFDGNGIIYRINTLASKDFHLTASPVGHKFSELLSVIYNNENIFTELIVDFEAPGTAQVQLPSKTIVRCNDTKVQFFVTGCITRLNERSYLFSFRNTMDEITREHILSMVLARTKIFPWFYDMDQNKMLIDAHWFSYLGIPAGDCTITQAEFFARVHPDEREMLADALQKQLSDHEIPDSFAYRLLRGDGTWEWFSEQSMYLSRTNDGSPYRVVGICQSIQEHKTTEETLCAARDKAQESEKLKSAFLANMSHEIRTPLNAIVGFSSLLTSGEIDLREEEAKEYAALINKNCDYLITLVGDILDLSRIETGSMEYYITNHSVEQILSDIYEKYANRMPEGVEFNLLLPPGDIHINTDAIRLRQVLEHLVGNAVKFTTKGHIDLGYTLAGDGDKIKLFVSDTGRGIPTEEIEKIFDRFYKIDIFTQGTGLGLSVCKTIIEEMGGQIIVSSQPGKGSRFTIKTPLDSTQKKIYIHEQ